jgi:hypothetical protein
MQITGIWKAREKELAKVKAERTNLKKMQKQFKIQKNKLIKSAVEKNKHQYEAKMVILKNREERIKSQANQRIVKAVNVAHNSVERNKHQYEAKMVILKKQGEKIKAGVDQQVAKAVKTAHDSEQLKSKLRESRIEKKLKNVMKKSLKVERKKAFSDAETKYRKWKISLESATKQIKSATTLNRIQEKRIKELEVQIKKHTTPQLEGLLYEQELMKELKKRFPHDEFVNTGKGGDIIQSVVNDKEVIGTIVYECKKVKKYDSKHVRQIYDAKHSRKAEFGVLVTNAMKRGTNGFFIEKEVIIVHSTGVLYVASLLRKQVVQISDMKLGQLEREKAIKNTLIYLESPDFTNSVSSIVQDSISLYTGLVEEVKRHVKTWKERISLYSNINSEANAIQNNTKALLSGKELEVKKTSTLPALIEFPKIQDES